MGGGVEGFSLTGLSGGLGEKGSSSVGIAVGDTMEGGVLESEETLLTSGDFCFELCVLQKRKECD